MEYKIKLKNTLQANKTFLRILDSQHTPRLVAKRKSLGQFLCFAVFKKNYLIPFLKNLFIYLFIYLFLAVLGLRCCTRAFSSCGEQGPPLFVVHGLLTAVSHVFAEHGLQSTGSVVVAHGLRCSAACGILPDQGSNPCPLHWQADSRPLCHQGSPLIPFN